MIGSLSRKETAYDWLGWSISANEHGEEFNESARERMVTGGLELKKYVNKYLYDIGDSVLEVGPFFNPITKNMGSNFTDKLVTYWENDPYVIQWLHEQVLPFNFKIKKRNLNALNNDGISLAEQFDAVIASQIFNYIDYNCFLKMIANAVHSNGLIFINNVVDYGLPKFFAENRPKSIEETIHSILLSGFEIVDYEILPTRNPEFQKDSRLLLVARKK